MTPAEVLAHARAGDVTALHSDPAAVAGAVHALLASGRGDDALELVGRAWRVWTSSGRVAEGQAAADAALAANLEGAGEWRARALYGAGVIAFRAGDGERSLRLNDELLELATSTGDVRGECDALTGLARLALRDGDYVEVVRLARSARERARAAGDVEAEASPLHLQAAGARLQGRYDEARELYLESLALNERLGSAAFVAMERHNLGWCEIHRGDAVAAERWFRERDAGPPPDAYGDAWSNLNWAAVALARGNLDEARSRFEAGAAALDRLGVALDPDDRFEYEWLRSRLEKARC